MALAKQAEGRYNSAMENRKRGGQQSYRRRRTAEAEVAGSDSSGGELSNRKKRKRKSAKGKQDRVVEMDLSGAPEGEISASVSDADLDAIPKDSRPRRGDGAYRRW